MSRPKLLDLFAGGQGAGVGYARAGYQVTAVDLVEHARHPEIAEFITADALTILADVDYCRSFVVIHASPPCQFHSGMTACRPGLASQYPDLIDAVRAELRNIGRPWVIENVTGSGLPHQSDMFGNHGIQLCGHMFGLKLYRHRLFETSHVVDAPHHPRHATPASSAGHWVPGTIMSVAGHVSPVSVAEEAMGIDWMTRDELSEAIPPAYTQWIGEQLLSTACGQPCG